MTQLKDLSGSHKITVDIPAEAAGSDFDIAAFVAPFNLEVTAVRLLPDADVTGASATETTIQVVNKGAAGDGTTVIAEESFEDSVDASEFVPVALTLSATEANRNVDEGHVVAVEKTHTSTGTAVTGAVEIEFINRGS